MAVSDTRKTTKEVELPNGYVKFTETIHSFSYNETVATRTVYASPWEVQTLSCYCCTCSEDDYGMASTDWACRNHNYGFGMRPCDIHNLPGQEIDDEAIKSSDPDAPKMPMPVQEYRNAVKAGLPTY